MTTKRLSGWARLWIILAVGMWSYGGWKLSQTSQPILASAYDRCAAPGLAPVDVVMGGSLRQCDRGPPGLLTCEDLERLERQCYASYAEGTHARAVMDAENKRTLRAFYLTVALRGGIVFVSPFLVALAAWLLAALVRWVWRGFRSETN